MWGGFRTTTNKQKSLLPDTVQNNKHKREERENKSLLSAFNWKKKSPPHLDIKSLEMQVPGDINTWLWMSFCGFHTLQGNYSLLYLLFKINNNTPATIPQSLRIPLSSQSHPFQTAFIPSTWLGQEKTAVFFSEQVWGCTPYGFTIEKICI